MQQQQSMVSLGFGGDGEAGKMDSRQVMPSAWAVLVM